MRRKPKPRRISTESNNHIDQVNQVSPSMIQTQNNSPDDLQLPSLFKVENNIVKSSVYIENDTKIESYDGNFSENFILSNSIEVLDSDQQTKGWFDFDKFPKWLSLVKKSDDADRINLYAILVNNSIVFKACSDLEQDVEIIFDFKAKYENESSGYDTVTEMEMYNNNQDLNEAENYENEASNLSYQSSLKRKFYDEDQESTQSSKMAKNSDISSFSEQYNIIYLHDAQKKNILNSSGSDSESRLLQIENDFKNEAVVADNDTKNQPKNKNITGTQIKIWNGSVEWKENLANSKNMRTLNAPILSKGVIDPNTGQIGPEIKLSQAQFWPQKILISIISKGLKDILSSHCQPPNQDLLLTTDTNSQELKQALSVGGALMYLGKLNQDIKIMMVTIQDDQIVCKIPSDQNNFIQIIKRKIQQLIMMIQQEQFIMPQRGQLTQVIIKNQVGGQLSQMMNQQDYSAILYTTINNNKNEIDQNIKINRNLKAIYNMFTFIVPSLKNIPFSMLNNTIYLVYGFLKLTRYHISNVCTQIMSKFNAEEKKILKSSYFEDVIKNSHLNTHVNFLDSLLYSDKATFEKKLLDDYFAVIKKPSAYEKMSNYEFFAHDMLSFLISFIKNDIKREHSTEISVEIDSSDTLFKFMIFLAFSFIRMIFIVFNLTNLNHIIKFYEELEKIKIGNDRLFYDVVNGDLIMMPNIIENLTYEGVNNILEYLGTLSFNYENGKVTLPDFFKFFKARLFGGIYAKCEINTVIDFWHIACLNNEHLRQALDQKSNANEKSSFSAGKVTHKSKSIFDDEKYRVYAACDVVSKYPIVLPNNVQINNIENNIDGGYVN